MNQPEAGFYYHYKHDYSSINNYAYEVIGVGIHTETNEYFVVYRPLYIEARVYKEGKLFDIRPLSMFMERIVKDGKTIDRFTKIQNELLVEKLSKIRGEMY